MNTATADRDFGRFDRRGFWREMVLARNVRDRHFWRKIFGGKCGFWRENMAMLNMCVNFGGETSTEVVNMTSL